MEIVWVAGQPVSRWQQFVDVIQALGFHYKRTLFGLPAAA